MLVQFYQATSRPSNTATS